MKIEVDIMGNDLVGYSRAGDVFHYRWAARRCLRLIHPKSTVKEIIIEGSKENEEEGEYVIDVSEYLEDESNDFDHISYYQLKHTTVRKTESFTLSNLKDTIVGFAKRYKFHLKENNYKVPVINISFEIVTNRPISSNFKKDIQSLINSEKVNDNFLRTIENYTDLNGEQLKNFCSLLKILDSEGDYSCQKYYLHLELSEILVGTVDSPIIESITSLVRDKVLPDSNGSIVREDILRYFGVTSSRDLFPAPVEFEKNNDFNVNRNQYNELQTQILNAVEPIIIHASGGVGKTFFARSLTRSLPKDTTIILYDCFGGGKYRNRSEQRHRHQDGLIQIINELALKDLCDPLIVQSNATEGDIMRKFLDRIKIVIGNIKENNKDANLILLIDAADNAEMAAKEFGDSCFVNELFREENIDGLKLVALCRTERVHLLNPKSSVKQLKLRAFNENESLEYLRSKFSEASDYDGKEFYRLTYGNPRVQSNAISLSSSLEEVLINLISIGNSVSEQIKSQLSNAISKIKDQLSKDYKNQIDSICTGLATLSPFIPLKILSKVSAVEESTIKSFIAELGRPLWLVDNSVQFRDEPTETWFRENFAANKEQLEYYIEQLKPFSNSFAYVATVLPSLMMQAEKYQEIIDIAISDDFLPSNPIDKRNVRIYRLNFAFKAALNQKRYADAVNIALRAGEETAGDKRQTELLKQNIDLIAPLMNVEKLQEIAFRRSLSGKWSGSENMYSASLLSNISQFKGESRSYLRAATNWLDQYFEKQEEPHFQNNVVQNDDVLELVFTVLNLYGVKMAIAFLSQWEGNFLIYDVSRKLFKRLIDLGNFETVNELAREGVRNQNVIIAFTHEMLEVGKIPESKYLKICLDLLISKHIRIFIPSYSIDDTRLNSLMSFLEICEIRKLSQKKILRVLNHFFQEQPNNYIFKNLNSKNRIVYMRSITLKYFILNKKLNSKNLFVSSEIKKNNYSLDQEIKENIEIINILKPWYDIRLNILLGNSITLFKNIDEITIQSKEFIRFKNYKYLEKEISKINCDILIFYPFKTKNLTEKFYLENLKNSNSLNIESHLRLVRAAFRNDNLSSVKKDCEEKAYYKIRTEKETGPEKKANWYSNLARSVMNSDVDDAATYFDMAIDAVSKFGDEVVERWEAVVSLSKNRGREEHVSNELAYRFMRCAELIGENVDREKYWDRNEAIITGMKLSPSSIFAIISRWNDRQVGNIEQQLFSVLSEGVSNKYISPVVSWSMHPFLNKYQLTDLAVKCIEHEINNEIKQNILSNLIMELNINGIIDNYLEKIIMVVEKFNLKLGEEEKLTVNDKSAKSIDNFDLSDSMINIQSDKEVKGEDSIVLEINDSPTIEEIKKTIKLFQLLPYEKKDNKLFWDYFFSKIKSNDIKSFLYVLIDDDNLNLYELKYVFSNLPSSWCRKISIQNEWSSFLEKIGEKYASNFAGKFTKDYFIEKLSLDLNNTEHINKGILNGLATQIGTLNASEFFGFVGLATPYISTIESTDLFTSALERFEEHIEDDFSDGNWSLSLSPSSNINNSIAGFIWSSLGSPVNETRWRAIHCIHRLAKMNSSEIIDELICWMKQKNIGAFGFQSYDFYKYHADLYLLISFSRISEEYPNLIVKHKEVFKDLALNNLPHILIQIYASKIAVNITEAYPEAYEKEEIIKLKTIGKSLLPIKTIKNYWEKTDSFWHSEELINKDFKIYHGYDFVDYWFKPLGNVFGISKEQIEDLVNDVIKHEMYLEFNGDYVEDKRQFLWSSSRDQEKTYHSHGSYPKIDTYSFYISYHAMLIVAGKLISKMSVTQVENEYEDKWEEWLSNHTLTRNDGFWLYDRRDPIPLKRRNLIHEVKKPNVDSTTDYSNIIEEVLVYENNEFWLNVCGYWQDKENEFLKNYRVSSALVSMEGTQSLLNALSTCSDPHDFKIPEYQESGMEYSVGQLNLRGWLHQKYISKGIDEFDPFSGNLLYPPYEIGSSIKEKFSLRTDSEKRKWRLPNEKIVVVGELWSELSMYDEEPSRFGNRLKASFSFIKELCLELQCNLIIEIQINRITKDFYNTRRSEIVGYQPPENKIFVFTSDGRLRDAERYYTIRKDDSE